MSFKPILGELAASLNAGIFFPPLATALLLPDAAGAVDAKVNKSSDRYILWYDEHVYPRFHHPKVKFDGEVVYKFRNAALHETTGYARAAYGYDRIIFTPRRGPMRMNFTVSRNNGGIEEAALMMDLVDFVGAIAQAVHKWEGGVMADATSDRRDRLAKMVRLHAGGISPHVLGAPVVG